MVLKPIYYRQICLSSLEGFKGIDINYNALPNAR